MIYFFLFLAGIFLGKMFYFNINFILYFYSILLIIYLFYFYAIQKENKKEKTFYIPINDENEKNEEELPIIRY